MTTIYVDGSAALEPDAAAHLAHLPDTGHRIILVGRDGHDASGLLRWSDRVPTLPADPPRGSWYVTADAGHCGDRRPGLRSVLIGPPATGPRAARCDSSARDLRDAVLEILAADAMR